MQMLSFTKNRYGEKLDEVMETLSERKRRFYSDDVSDDSYVIALSSLPGGFSTAFFECKDMSDMYRTIYSIMGEVRGSAYKNLNQKHCVAEKLYAPDMPTTTAMILADYDMWPRINYGTGKQFKFSRQNGVIDGTNSIYQVA